MIDVHSHLIPNIDDGSRSVEQSLATLERFAAEGVQDVVLTPHLRASEIGLDPEDALERREAAFEPLSARAAAMPRLHLGFEIMLDQPLPSAAAADRRFSLAGSRYYLVEFTMGVVGRFALLALEQIAELGVIPVVAHPERYYSCNAAVVAEWRNVGAKIQVDATTVTRKSPRGRSARRLLSAGLADIVAADNHGDRRSIRTAVDFLSGHGYHAVGHELASRNPNAILEDGELRAVQPVDVREGFWSRLKGSLGY